MLDKFYKGIEERTFYREGKAYADFMAVFEDSRGYVMCAPHDYLTRACVSSGSERQSFFDNGITMFQIERAHRDFCYQQVRQDIAKAERRKRPVQELATLTGVSRYEFRGEEILGEPSLGRMLRCYHTIDCDHDSWTCEFSS